MAVVELHGGPLDGTLHETFLGWPVPDNMGLPDPTKPEIHWYLTRADHLHADYEKTEAMKP